MGTTNILEEPFRLTNADPVIVAANSAAVARWYDLWTYQVPNGMSLVLKPTDAFSVYLDRSTGSTEISQTAARVKIEKRDSSQSDIQLVYGPTLYKEAIEFQDINKFARLRLPASVVVVNEREWLAISIYYATYAAVVAYCYFVLQTTRIRKAIGA